MKTLAIPHSIKSTLIAIGGLFLIALILAPLLRDFSLLSSHIASRASNNNASGSSSAKDTNSGFFIILQTSLQNSAQSIDSYVKHHLATIAKKAALKDIYSKDTTKTMLYMLNQQTIHNTLTDIQSIWLEAIQKGGPDFEATSFKQAFNKMLSSSELRISDKIGELLFERLEHILEHQLPNISSVGLQEFIEKWQESIIEPLSEHYLYVLNRNYTTISQATYDTVYMVFASIIVAVLFGLPLGVLLAITKRGKILSSPTFNTILGSLVNIVRSFPFIILIVLLLPISGFLVGSIVGPTAAIVPLGIAAIPFVARLFEGAFDEVNSGLIEATMSMGASKIDVIKMMIQEAMPGLINAIIITIIGLIGYSAMAGALGAGGLGDVAIRLGFQSFVGDILFSSVVVIIILVQWIQSIGDSIVERLRKYR